MSPLSVLAILVGFLQACTFSQSFNSSIEGLSAASNQAKVVSLNTPSDGTSAKGFNLNDFRWQNRILLVFSPSKQSAPYQQQRHIWQSDTAGVRERHLKLVEVIPTESNVDGQPIAPTAAAQLRQQFGVGTEDFVVILLGKDSMEKQRSQNPVSLTQLFRTIDAMPMRQQEMRSQ